MNTPLKLTLGRLLILPVFLVLYFFYQNFNIPLAVLPYPLLALLIICELSDVFDGRIARKSNQVTELGKILDPMADSIVHLSIFLSFTHGIIKLPMLLVLIFVCRDVVISTLRTLCALKGQTLAARKSGKIKAIMQAITICAIVVLMIPHSLGFLSLEGLRLASTSMVTITAFYTILSGLEYIWAHRSDIRESLN